MQRRVSLGGGALFAFILTASFGAVLLALNTPNTEDISQAPEGASVDEVLTEGLSTDEPWRETAWWKLTEIADMATRGAQTVSPEWLSRTPDLSTPIPRQHFARLAGYGNILTNSGPMSGPAKFQTTGRWLARLSNDKTIAVFVGFQTKDWLQPNPISQLLVQYWNAEDSTELTGGGIVDSLLQDISLSIIDADRYTLRLRTTANVELEFDALTLTQTLRDQPTVMTRVTPNGIIREEGILAISDPDIDVYNTWSGTINGHAAQIGAGQRTFSRDGSSAWGTGIVLFTTDLAPLSANSPVEQIDVQDSNGPLKVFDEMDGKIILIDRYGYEFVFDPVLKTAGRAASDPSLLRGTVYDLPTPWPTVVP